MSNSFPNKHPAKAPDGPRPVLISKTAAFSIPPASVFPHPNAVTLYTSTPTPQTD